MQFMAEEEALVNPKKKSLDPSDLYYTLPETHSEIYPSKSMVGSDEVFPLGDGLFSGANS